MGKLVDKSIRVGLCGCAGLVGGLDRLEARLEISSGRLCRIGWRILIVHKISSRRKAGRVLRGLALWLSSASLSRWIYWVRERGGCRWIGSVVGLLEPFVPKVQEKTVIVIVAPIVAAVHLDGCVQVRGFLSLRSGLIAMCAKVNTCE